MSAQSDRLDLPPTYPIDVATQLKAPVIGFYGAEDHGNPLESVDAMSASLSSVNSPSRINVFPDAGHAIFASYRPRYNADAAEAAWQQKLERFSAHGT